MNTIDNLITFIKRLFCDHYRLEFVRNIYGDEIQMWGYRRAIWKCAKCGALVPADYLHHSEKETP